MSETNEVKKPNVPAGMLEMDEYLFSHTAAEFAFGKFETCYPCPEDIKAILIAEVRDHVRESLRLHRFQVFAWLLSNDISLPLNLLADLTHAEVGKQKPDERIQPDAEQTKETKDAGGAR